MALSADDFNAKNNIKNDVFHFRIGSIYFVGYFFLLSFASSSANVHIEVYCIEFGTAFSVLPTS